MVDENGIPKRLRELELRVEGHIRSTEEFRMNLREHMEHEERALKAMEESIRKVSNKVAGIMGVFTVIIGLVMWLVTGGK